MRSADLRHTAATLPKTLDRTHDLVRLKVAALLAVLDNRLDMTIEDWQLATVLKVTSDAVRDSVRQVVAAQAETQERQLSSRQAHRQLAATELIEDHAEAKRCQAEVDCAGRCEKGEGHARYDRSRRTTPRKQEGPIGVG